MNTFSLPLYDLNCMGCANKIKRALQEEHDVSIEKLSPTHIELITPSIYKAIHATIVKQGYKVGNKQEFLLSGLNCNKCVEKLNKHLADSDDLVILDISTTSLIIDTHIDSHLVQKLIEQIGFEGELNTQQQQTATQESAAPSVDTPTPTSASHQTVSTHLQINGMTCASCVASVEKALMSVEGVVKAQVNLSESSALVLSDNELVESKKQQLLDAIKTAGYLGELVESPKAAQEKQAQQLASNRSLHKRNAWLGLIVGGPLMAWGVFGGSMMIRNTQDQLAWGGIGLLCLLLLCTAGKHFFHNAWQALIHRRATMDSLVAMGTGAAWLYSMLIVLWPGWFPESARHVYFEASAMIIGLISLGHYIEAKAKAKTTHSIQALINLQPQTALLIANGIEQTIAVEDIKTGMTLRIRPGDKVPVDGVVLSGSSYIDESMLTGEPIPTHKDHGDNVAAGTLNQDGSLVITAEGVGSETMLSRIIQLVRQAQSSKPAIAKLADQISAVFVPIVVVIALVAAAVWYFVGPQPALSHMLVVSTTVLIIACPCALGLATPLSVTVGVGKAAELGILIRDADALQSASKINTVVFDKTGTLTQGKPSVQKLFNITDQQDSILEMLYGTERLSEHPLAKAVCEHIDQMGFIAKEPNSFNNLQGRGVEASFGQDSMVVGSLQHMESLGISLTLFEAEIQECIDNAWTPIVVALNNKVQVLVAVSDPIKPEAKRAIKSLKALNIDTVMLTGDNQAVAQAIGLQLGINSVIAQVLPNQKADQIQNLQAQGKHVAMVGDGINDAPALAQADLGVAMGAGSDVAIESAQVTLLNSSPLSVIRTIELSSATVKNMKQNLFGAFVYNSLGIPIAAGVLYPAFGFLLSPVFAGAAMALSSITVVSNANRLRLFQTKY
ncbi:copper-translocating P-type ATPase [Vibrio paucivorans]